VSNARKKKRRPGSSYRAPAPPAPRRGLLDSLFPARAPGTSPMPKLLHTFTRGLATILGTPVLVIAVPVVLLVEWGILLALGFQGPFTLLGGTFGIPPVSTYANAILSSSVFTSTTGGVTSALGPLLGIVVFLTLTAAIHACVTTAAVEHLRTGGVSAWAIRRAVHVLPVTVACGLANLGILIAANVVGSLGGFLGLLVLFGAMAAGVYFFAFAPAIAADEDRPVTMTLSRSARAARMPGSNNLTLAVVYAVPAFLLLLAVVPTGPIGVNPSIRAWVALILVNELQMSVAATFAYRYLSVAGSVPEVAPARPRRR
jgi:hypothetical protein